MKTLQALRQRKDNAQMSFNGRSIIFFFYFTFAGRIETGVKVDTMMMRLFVWIFFFFCLFLYSLPQGFSFPHSRKYPSIRWQSEKIVFSSSGATLRMLFQQHLLTIEIFAHWPSSCSNLKETTTMMTVFFKKTLFDNYLPGHFSTYYTIPR